MKLKNNKGPILLYIIGFLTILGGVAFLYMSKISQDQERLIQQNRIFEQNENGIVLVDIYNISEPIPTQKKAETVYLIDTGKKLMLLQASSGDKVLKEISDNYKKLANNPARIIVKVVPTSNKVSDFLKELNIDESLKQQFRRDKYLSSYEVDKDLFSMKIGFFILLGLGILIIGQGIYHASRIKKAYATLYQSYPELAEDITLLRQGEFYDEQIGLALYKNHLVAFRIGTGVVDLRNVQGIRYVLETFRYNGIPTGSRYYFEFHEMSGKKYKLFFKKIRANADEKIAPLFYIIEQRFPHIAFIR